ncbi:lactamase [Pluteus cervinus]|uniref:Lactamase n=1 Tax=Pluteus cervinus TaxID=181527 RepID=A0ACD3AWC1_9AGAR|nr:lactamase [Pluteus cervinus]
MEKLEALASIARLSDHVVRVLGQNPGKFTLQGTNTYIVGKQNPYTLIDTGEGKEEYLPVLEKALRDTVESPNKDQPIISDIIISHWHHDHVEGLPGVLNLLRKMWDEQKPGYSAHYKPPRLHKFPIPTGFTPPSAFYTLPSFTERLPKDLYTSSPDGEVFHRLHDSQIVTSSSIRVLHAPGHTVDSVCLYIPQDRALYTADNVLGQGTAVFEDLGVYLKSLGKMLEYGRDDEGHYDVLYPGHGPVIIEGREVISTYIKHRLEREEQVLSLLKSTPPDEPASVDASGSEQAWTTWTLVTKLYAAYPEPLWLPAARGIDLHLRKLEAEGRVKRLGGDGKDTRWQFV